MITFTGIEQTIMYPGRIYRLSYALKGFFEGIAFTKEDVYEAFENTRKELFGYGLRLSGVGVEDTSSLFGSASFNLYVTVLKALPVSQFNQVFLKYANSAGFPDIFYEVYFVSCREVSGSPEPVKPDSVLLELGSYLKWAVIGLGIFYFGPALKTISKSIADWVGSVKERRKEE